MAKYNKPNNLQYPDLPGKCVSADASMVRPLGTALQILRMKQLIKRTGLSRATLYVLQATDPTFPQKISLTQRTVGYLESDVDAWIVARAKSSISAQ